jgi:hypothetical protein
MKYSIVWDDVATSNIFEVASLSGDSGGTVMAVDELNRRLTDDPRQSGAIDHEGLWTFALHRFLALYEIDEPDHIVRVVALRLRRQ